MDIEMEEMQRQKAALAQELEVQVTCCRQEWKAKQEQIEQLRNAPEDATTNALNVLTRRTEIKVCRFWTASHVLVTDLKQSFCWFVGPL